MYSVFYRLVNQAPYGRKALRILAAGATLLIAVGLVGRYWIYAKALEWMLVVGFVMLVVFMFLSAYKVQASDTQMLQFVRKLFFWSLAVLHTGVLFGLMQWENNRVLICVGGAVTLITMPIYIYLLRKARLLAGSKQETK